MGAGETPSETAGAAGRPAEGRTASPPAERGESRWGNPLAPPPEPMTRATVAGGRTISRRLVLAGLGLGGAVGAGLYLAAGGRSDPEPLTVAGTLPLSGPRQSIGVPLERGLRSWAAAVNARGGLLGREVEVSVGDDGGQPDAARAEYRSLVEDADLLVAPYGTPATERVIDLVEAAGVPTVAHTAGARDLWAGGRQWTVQLLNPVDTFLHGTLDVAAAHGANSIAFVHREDGFTPATITGAVAKADRDGWTVRDVRAYGSTDELDRLVEELADRPPDVVVGGGFQPGEPGGGFLPDALALARSYDRASWEADLACWSIGASFPAFGAQLGEPAAGATGVTGWKPYVDYPANDRFGRRYADRWGEPPDSHAAQGYATGQVLQAAVATAESLDPAAVRDALFGLSIETVFGRYRVDSRGLQVGKENAVVQWQDGEPAVVGPETVQAAPLVYPAG